MPVFLVGITPDFDYPDELIWVNRLLDSGLDFMHIRKPGASGTALAAYRKGIHTRHQRKILDPERLRSTHSIRELLKRDAPGEKFFISPVFDSLSKSGYAGKSALLKAGALKRQGEWIALGGICPDNIGLVEESGFDGAALLGHLWLGNDPVERLTQLKRKRL